MIFSLKIKESVKSGLTSQGPLYWTRDPKIQTRNNKARNAWTLGDEVFDTVYTCFGCNRQALPDVISQFLPEM